MRRLRLLHAVHDFLPRHAAGSEIYAHDLATTLARDHDVWVLAAEYDPAASHGALRWRREGTLPVVEIVNNWEFRAFDETYASPRLNAQLGHVLDAVRPDVLHVHNLLNLSLDLPRLALARGIPTVATLHDYTLVCISGGQRLHRADQHVCDVIDPERCARCFGESPFAPQLAAGRTAAVSKSGTLLRTAAAVRRRLPLLATAIGSRLPRPALSADDVRRRLAYVRHVYDTIELFVAPSAALAEEYVRLGLPAERMTVSANGSSVRGSVRARPAGASVVRIGFVGSIVWHKGVHVLVDAARELRGAAEVVIHGDPGVSPEYAAHLREAARGLPVTFAGPFDRAAVGRVYADLDVLVVPSLWPENAPLVLQEATAHGVPIVASAIGGMPEFVRDGVNGRLFPAGSAAALLRILQELISAPEERARLASAPAAVKTIDQDAADWTQRYLQVLAAASGARASLP